MKTTKQMAILLVIALFASSAPVATPTITNGRIEVKKMLANGPHQPPIMTPHVGGSKPPCPSGETCG